MFRALPSILIPTSTFPQHPSLLLQFYQFCLCFFLLGVLFLHASHPPLNTCPAYLFILLTLASVSFWLPLLTYLSLLPQHPSLPPLHFIHFSLFLSGFLSLPASHPSLIARPSHLFILSIVAFVSFWFPLLTYLSPFPQHPSPLPLQFYPFWPLLLFAWPSLPSYLPLILPSTPVPTTSSVLSTLASVSFPGFLFLPASHPSLIACPYYVFILSILTSSCSMSSSLPIILPPTPNLFSFIHFDLFFPPDVLFLPASHRALIARPCTTSSLYPF